MKTTNEIEKQLKSKADDYIKQKAKEMYNIHKEIAEFIGINPSFIDYVTRLTDYDEATLEDKSGYVSHADAYDTMKKYRLELEINYKQKLVAKYTKELLSKLDLLG